VRSDKRSPVKRFNPKVPIIIETEIAENIETIEDHVGASSSLVPSCRSL
jgi:hypothetical protein